MIGNLKILPIGTKMTSFNAEFLARISAIIENEEGLSIDLKEFIASSTKIYKELKGKDASKPVKKAKNTVKIVSVKEKRAPTAYNIFMKAKLAILKEREQKMENPKSSRDLMKEVGRLWQESKLIVKIEDDDMDE